MLNHNALGLLIHWVQWRGWGWLTSEGGSLWVEANGSGTELRSGCKQILAQESRDKATLPCSSLLTAETREDPEMASEAWASHAHEEAQASSHTVVKSTVSRLATAAAENVLEMHSWALPHICGFRNSGAGAQPSGFEQALQLTLVLAKFWQPQLYPQLSSWLWKWVRGRYPERSNIYLKQSLKISFKQDQVSHEFLSWVLNITRKRIRNFCSLAKK